MNHIENVIPVKLTTGLFGRYIHGSSLTMGLVEIKAGSDLPEHQHVHEQITYILEGQLDMKIGGTPVTLTEGMYQIIPPNTPHSAIAKSDCKTLDIFHPVREDYKIKQT